MRCIIITDREHEDACTQFIKIPDNVSIDSAIKDIKRTLESFLLKGTGVAGYCENLVEIKTEEWQLDTEKLPELIFVSELSEAEKQQLYKKYGEPTCPGYKIQQRKGGEKSGRKKTHG